MCTDRCNCNAFDRLEMGVWRVLLNGSRADVPLDGLTGYALGGVNVRDSERNGLLNTEDTVGRVLKRPQ
jgi:hypothetical protein